MQNPSTQLRTLPLSLLALASLAIGCASGPATDSNGPGNGWVRASSSLASEIERQAEALPWTHGRERVDLISWFAIVGEPAYDTLITCLDDERPVVVGTALAALGATGDSRLVPFLRDAESATWTEVLVLESARARVRLGDWSAIPSLIDGMESDNPIKRSLSAQVIFEATHENLGFEPRADAQSRADAIVRWRAWWQARASDEMLASN